MECSATISDDGLYRYRLGRRWGDWGVMVFIMLNPSTADAFQDDRTITRCISFAEREGCAGIEVVNLYALRTSKPEHLLHHPDPEGPENESHWSDVLYGPHVARIVAAWGAGIPKAAPKSRALAAHIDDNARWRCLGTTAIGLPRHPLYLPASAPLQPLVSLPVTTERKPA